MSSDGHAHDCRVIHDGEGYNRRRHVNQFCLCMFCWHDIATLTADLANERAEVERLRDEVAALRQWKAEATAVLTQWFNVADQIVQEMDFNDTIGRPKMDIVAEEVARLRALVAEQHAEVLRLRTAGDALAEVVDDWPELVAAWQETRNG